MYFEAFRMVSIEPVVGELSLIGPKARGELISLEVKLRASFSKGVQSQIWLETLITTIRWSST
ncbi:MAG: hypothetical protein QXL96_10615 [Ignisphaera sp.]